ncbi:MAG: tetratricopeptide repeat protein, partial [Planctomycetota bacterium]
KVLLAGKSASGKAIQRFQREIEIMVKLQHSRIVQIYDSGKEGDEFYLAMEYVEGSPLSKRIKDLNLNDKVDIVQKVLNTLTYAHHQGVLHRDLKLENILMTPQNEPKILDFGIAKLLNTDIQEENGEDIATLTKSGVMLGTAQYMSPEQACGNIKESDFRTDVYAMGVCLYHLLTQQFPHEGKTLHQLLYRIIHEEPTPPSQYLSNLRPDLEAILLKSLEKEKEHRYPSAQAFAEDLERFLRGYPVEAFQWNLQTQLQHWIRPHKKHFLGSLFILILIVSAFVLKSILAYQERSTLFQQKYQLALEEAKKSFSGSLENFSSHFQIWNYLSESLQIWPNHPSAEQKKWEIGEQILQKILMQENHFLGDYVLQEMQQLQSIPEEKRIKRKQFWDQQKNKQWKKEEKRFSTWLSRLKTEKFSDEFGIDFIFETLKMSAPTINTQLIELLREGNTFFESDIPDLNKSRFYLWILRLINRKKLLNILPLIEEGLSRIIQQESQSILREQNIHRIDYLVELANYLWVIKASSKTDFLLEMRCILGEHKLFWSKTEFIYKKLSQLKLTAEGYKQTNTTASDYFQSGITKYSSGEFDGAIADFSEVIRLDPQNYTAYINRGNVKQAKEDYSGAIADYNVSIQINPKDADAYANRGTAKYAQKDWAGALADHTSAIQLNPQDFSAYTNRGNIKKDGQDYEGALADYSSAISINPQDTETYLNRGEVQQIQGNLVKAIQDYDKAIQLNPQFAIAYNSRGNARLIQGEFDKAIQDYTEAIRLNPQFATAYINLATAKTSKKDWNGAIADYTEAIRIQPRDPEAYNSRGITKSFKEDWDGAIVDYTEAIRLNPEFAKSYYNRGMIKQAKQDYTGAISDYTLTIQYAPEFLSSYLNRGNLYLFLKKSNLAKEDFKMFLFLRKNSLLRHKFNNLGCKFCKFSRNLNPSKLVISFAIFGIE